MKMFRPYVIIDNTKPHPLAEHVGGTNYGTSLFEEGHLQGLFEEEFECMMFGLNATDDDTVI